MSVANKYLAESVRVSEEMKTVFMLSSGAHLTFEYTFSCKSLSANLFFNMKLSKLLWIDSYDLLTNVHPMHSCMVVPFWVENDLPVPSVRDFVRQQTVVLNYITEDFKEKLAAYTLDTIINS